MSAQELTSADRVVLYITLGNQTDKAGFAQQIRACSTALTRSSIQTFLPVSLPTMRRTVHRLPQRPLFDAAGRERSAEPD